MATLYGVGVGPGDPDLVTLKAARLLGTVPVVAYPANPQGFSLALSIAENHLNPDAVHIPMEMAFTVDRQSAHNAYDAGAVNIAAHLAAGRDVAVLCEGDPLLFGSFAYVLERLPQGPDSPHDRVEVIPGISALTACAAALTAPLALGSQPLLCLPGTLSADALRTALSGVDAVALFKVGRHLEKVHQALTEVGLAENARCVIQASQQEQKILTLDEALSQGLPYFSMILARRTAVA